jgi:SAM-dependent methyltransferase
MEEGVTTNSGIFGEILPGNVAGQTFTPLHDGLDGIEVLVGTYARENRCTFRFALLDGAGPGRKETAVVEIPASEIPDNLWIRFPFQPVRDSAGKPLYFTIESPDAAPGNALTLWTSEEAPNPKMSMFANHKPCKGTLCFRPHYAGLEKDPYFREWEAWSRDEKLAFTMMDGSSSEEEIQERGTLVADVLGRILGLQKEHRVLEVGCGVGRISRELAPKVRAYTCLDISPGLLERAQKRMDHLSHVTFVPLDDPELTVFPDASFDRIFSHIVFFHLPREQVFAYLQQFARLLTADGLAYFDTWNLVHPRGFQRWLLEIHLHRKGEKPHAHNRFQTKEEMDFLVSAAGLETVLSTRSTLLHYVVAPAPCDGEHRPAPLSPEEFEEELQRLFAVYPELDPESENDPFAIPLP